MKRNDNHLSHVDVILGQLSQVAVPPDVQQRLEACVDEFCETSLAEAKRRNLAATRTQNRTRRWFVGASVAASLTVVVSFFALDGQDAWAQVVGTLQSKPWVRFTVQIPDEMTAPEGSDPPEHWLSDKFKVAAFKRGDRVQFMDLAQQESSIYSPQKEAVTLMTVGDQEIAAFGFLETLRRLVSRGEKNELNLPESAVQIVKRTQAEVQAEGRHWTEFKFQCRNPKRSPSDYQVIVRVNPESGLPVELRTTEKFSPDDRVAEWTLAIDYPESGPADIYAMGVPRDATVIDHRRPGVTTENGEEIKKFLAAYRAARQKPLASSSVEIGQEIGGRITPSKSEFPGHFMPARVGYPNILMGGSPVDNPDCKVTLDRRPLSGPQGTVLLHILVETTVGANDCFYWIAPEKDYLVLRSEMHFSGEDHVEWNNLTWIIDRLQQSPGGRWYPSVVRYGRIKTHGDDLSNERLPRDPRPIQDRDLVEIGPTNTVMLRYKVAFTEQKE